MTEPADLSATEARRLIGEKRLSPVELVESAIARIETLDGAINAIPERDFDRARDGAKASERAVMAGEPLGPLHGLTLGVKDMTNVAGLKTTFGSPAFRDNVAPADDGIISALKDAGAIVLGKTNVPEWSAGANSRNPVYGTTGNPFDPTKSAAGSSGGSAAALATGMVAIATGTDTGGSLRNPAAFCGVVGFRPTPGLVPSENAGMGWLPLGTGGPMGRTVADTALMLSTIIAPDKRDPLSMSERVSPDALRRLPEVDLSALSVAMTPDFGFAPVERLIADTFADKVGRFRAVFRRADDAHPDCTDADEMFEVLRALAFLGPHKRLLEASPELVGPNVAANVREGLGYSAAQVARGLEQQTALYRRWQTFFAETDFVLSPTVAITPRDWRELYPSEIDGKPTRTYFHWLALAYAPTLAGHPAVSLPVGLDHAGMPFGLQIVGPRGADLETLAMAAALERLLADDPQTARPVPDLSALAAAPMIADMADDRGHGGLLPVIGRRGAQLPNTVVCFLRRSSAAR
ncbi:amidase [Acuticoccus sp. M5D2P5]|uniref:amidase n=1 Tax=Acuticoccus kalidii TaxID=2910977 RepID=UPI001EED59D4|nr:amidase family protein [Acuticoccus kalidii]MCF3933134.1 amidase [Acuticoccus kalidii]